MSIEEIQESTPSAMTDDQIREFLTEQGVGVLGLPDGEVPYLLPLSFGYDDESTLYLVFLLFGTESRKETLSDRAERARFLVYDAASVNEWRSLILTGRIERIADDEWPALRDAMENAWYPDVFSGADPMRGIDGYRFEIDEWTGIQHGT